MFNDRAIEEELQRSKDEYDRLKRSIVEAERDIERHARLTRASKSDLEKAERQLETQKEDHERTVRAFKDAESKLDEYKRKEGDYRNKINALEVRLRALANQVGSKKF